MSQKRVAIALAVGLGLMLLIAAASQAKQAAAVNGNVLYVSHDPVCGGRAPCYHSLQAAIDAAQSGDEVRVSADSLTYSGVTTVTVGGVPYLQVAMITKSLSLIGGYNSSDWDTYNPEMPASIDAEGHGRGITILGTGSERVVISGFAIMHGDYTGLGNAPGVSNRACGRTGGDCGGGLFARRAQLRMADCFFMYNTASRNVTYSDGGGAYLWELASGSTVERTMFYDNATGPGFGHAGGAAVLSGSALSFLDCSFTMNSAGGEGGALSIFQPSGRVVVERTIFSGNVARGDSGGAVWASLTREGDALLLSRVRMLMNGASAQGAALAVEKTGSGSTSVYLVNSLLYSNQIGSPDGFSSAIDLGNGMAGATLTFHAAHVTAAVTGADSFLRAASSSGGTARAVLSNTLIIGGSAAFVGDKGGTGDLSISHTRTLAYLVPELHRIQQGVPTFVATEQVFGDPMLTEDGCPEYGSAAVNAGIDVGAHEDLDGRRRPVGLPDIGACEYASRLYLPVGARQLTIGRGAEAYVRSEPAGELR